MSTIRDVRGAMRGAEASFEKWKQGFLRDFFAADGKAAMRELRESLSDEQVKALREMNPGALAEFEKLIGYDQRR